MILLSKEIVKRTLPQNIQSKDIYLFEHEVQKQIEECAAYECTHLIINNLRIWSINNSNNLKIIEKVGFFKFLFKVAQFFFKNEITCIKEPLIIITNKWSESYFHWLLDTLPKLFLIENSKSLCSMSVYIPRSLYEKNYVKQSLAIFKNLNFEINENRKIYQSSSIIVPDLCLSGNYHESLIVRLRSKFLEMYSLNSVPYSRIFIFRSGEFRKIINFIEIQPILLSYQFKIIDYETLDFQDQINYSTHCKILMGVHGAGLTNMIFMKPGTTVVELRRNGDTENNCFFSLASALAIRYNYLLCEVDNDSIVTQKNNFLVDKKRFKSILDSICVENI